MEALAIGPQPMAASPTQAPTATPANAPCARSSVATPKTMSARKKVSAISESRAASAPPMRGTVAPASPASPTMAVMASPASAPPASCDAA